MTSVIDQLRGGPDVWRLAGSILNSGVAFLIERMSRASVISDVVAPEGESRGLVHHGFVEFARAVHGSTEEFLNVGFAEGRLGEEFAFVSAILGDDESTVLACQVSVTKAP